MERRRLDDSADPSAFAGQPDPTFQGVRDAALAGLLEDIAALPLGDAAAVAHGVLRAAGRERRRDAFVRLIATHAVSLDLTLVASDERGFAGYPGLSVDNGVG